MKQKLKQSFTTYVEYAKTKGIFPPPVKQTGGTTIGVIVPSEQQPQWIRKTFNKIEKCNEFEQLVYDLVSHTSSGKSEKDPENYVKFTPYYWDHKRMLRSFFRRSGMYLEISDGENINPNEYFELLWKNINTPEIKTTRLRLIENVAFFNNYIDFKDFKIQKLSITEWKELSNSDINEIFFPNAVYDIDVLSQYWYIIEKSYNPLVSDKYKEKIKGKGGIFDFDFKIDTTVSVTFPDKTLQLLALYDWPTDKWKEIEKDWGWLRFDIPFGLSFQDSLLKSPGSSPILSGLNLQPRFSPSGDEIGVEPTFITHMQESEEDRLIKVVEKSQTFFNSIDLTKCKWNFLNMSMGYLSKVFFSSGTEEFLWHITAIESLIGEDQEIIKSLKRRIAIILGDNNIEQIENINTEINKIYVFRSKLVHGKESQRKKLYQGHLTLSRNYARKITLWFIMLLFYLNGQLKRNGINYDKYPDQADLLLMLDHKLKNFKINDTLINTPRRFPIIDLWGE